MNGLVANNIHGFKVYVSNNLPTDGTGAGTAGTKPQDDNFGVILAGQEEACCNCRADQQS